MKKTFLTAVICALTATSAVFGQHQQSITFSGPSEWTPGTTVSLDVSLTFSGYNALGLSYWLEAQNPLAQYITITNIQWFTFPQHGQPVYPINFEGGIVVGGYGGEQFDLGGEPGNPPGFIGPGTYHINTITFSLAPNAPTGSFILRSGVTSPRISEVTDTDFNDNNILPPGTFVINVVPEPSTLALLSFAVVGSGQLIYRRRNR
jgi:PEP-CTERM motif